MNTSLPFPSSSIYHTKQSLPKRDKIVIKQLESNEKKGASNILF